MTYSNNKHREAISQSIRNNTLSHAYIICGGDDDSRDQFITDIVKEIYCLDRTGAPCMSCSNCRKIDNNNMEDLIVIDKDDSSIKVNQIKELASTLSNKPFTTRTVAVIKHADSMTPESQNKLLKNLEEPAPGTVIMLSCSNLFSLYPTIRSRSIIVNMGSVDIALDSGLEESAANIVKYSMSNKPLNSIFLEVKECADSVSDAVNLLNAMEVFLRDILVGRYSKELLFDNDNRQIVDRIDWSKGFPFAAYLKHLEAAKADLRRNINWKYTLKNLIINFKQEELNG